MLGALIGVAFAKLSFMKDRLLLLAFTLIIPFTAHAQANPPPPELAIATKGNELAYDKTVMTAHAGQTVRVTFSNRSDPASDFRHNWVLVKPGREEQVVTDSVQAGQSRDYVPDTPDVVAHTKLLKAGESQSVQFQVPDTPGDYPYFCSFPGHSGLLKGVLKVSP